MCRDCIFATAARITTICQVTEPTGLRERNKRERRRRLEDVALVSDSIENDKGANWYGNSRSLAMAIDRQPGTNTVAVVVFEAWRQNGYAGGA